MDEKTNKATRGKQLKVRLEMRGTGKTRRRKTGNVERLTSVDEENQMEIDDSDVVRQEVSDDILSNDEEWGEANDVKTENEQEMVEEGRVIMYTKKEQASMATKLMKPYYR